MTPALFYAVAGAALFAMGLHGVLLRRHLVRRVIAINVMGSGVFLVFLAMAARGGSSDPVPQALVITGIVVTFGITALALALILCLHARTGSVTVDGPMGEGGPEESGPASPPESNG